MSWISASTTVLTRESKPLEVQFLSTDGPRFLCLKYQILIYFEDRLKTTEVRPGVYDTKNVYIISKKSVRGKRMFIEQAYKFFDYE